MDGQDNVLNSWLKFLNPDTLKSNLIAASLFLAAWETLRGSVIDQLRGFYCFGFDQDGDKIDPSYTQKVLSLHKSPFQASLLWFRESGAIDDSDLELADRIREHRNEIAHNLPEFVSTMDREIDMELFAGICELVSKIDRWWIREIEIPTNPDFDDPVLGEIDYDGVTSGRMMFLSMMLQLAAGDEAEAGKWYDQFAEEAQKAMHSTQNTSSND